MLSECDSCYAGCEQGRDMSRFGPRQVGVDRAEGGNKPVRRRWLQAGGGSWLNRHGGQCGLDKGSVTEAAWRLRQAQECVCG